MKRSTNRILAAVLAGLFGLFLTYGSLTSSDFPRGLYGPPNNSEAHWDSIELLNANRLWNYNLNFNPSLALYLERCDDRGLRAVLTPPGDFYMSYYSCGQHHIYEAEIDYDSSSSVMLGDHPELFYFFVHSDSSTHPVRGELDLTLPSGGASWRCTKDASYGAGFMLNGPNETLEGENDIGTWANQNRVSTAESQFCSIIRVMANLTGLAATDTVFSWRIFKSSGSTGITLNSAYYTADSFAAVTYPQWKQFELEYTIPTGGMNLMYTVDWKNKCNFWVDWIEFYDMNRGRYLFTDSTTRANTLAQIANQCDSLEGIYGNALAAWKQSDEPSRSQFEAHGVVNLMAREELQFPPVTPFAQLSDFAWFLRRPELFTFLGRPPILDTDIYPFQGPLSKQPGDQTELDTLAARMERCYQAAADSSMPFHFTGQVVSWLDSGEVVWDLRDPRRAEILAETYMALAHGATEITFYKYTSGPPYGTQPDDSCWALVNTFDGSYSHSPSEPHFLAEKWQAVHDVFAQLDSIGGILLTLERKGAYLAKDANGNFAPTMSLDSVYFEEEPRNSAWIEVGQFTDTLTQTQEYLILVNRRTDGDRHITVETDKSGTWALRDLYTQEQFISSTGDFKAIPFDSGEGRVFKLEAFK